MDVPNAQHTTSFRLIFSLDSDLPANNYMKLILPTELSSI